MIRVVHATVRSESPAIQARWFKVTHPAFLQLADSTKYALFAEVVLAEASVIDGFLFLQLIGDAPLSKSGESVPGSAGTYIGSPHP